MSVRKGGIDRMFIAERLKKCREEKKLSQEDLTFELDKIGFRVTRQTLYNWETEATVPDANAIATLSAYFQKPIQYFFDQIPYHSGKG